MAIAACMLGKFPPAVDAIAMVPALAMEAMEERRLNRQTKASQIDVCLKRCKRCLPSCTADVRR
jgi:hypothetical protein